MELSAQLKPTTKRPRSTSSLQFRLPLTNIKILIRDSEDNGCCQDRVVVSCGDRAGAWQWIVSNVSLVLTGWLNDHDCYVERSRYKVRETGAGLAVQVYASRTNLDHARDCFCFTCGRR